MIVSSVAAPLHLPVREARDLPVQQMSAGATRFQPPTPGAGVVFGDCFGNSERPVRWSVE